MHPRGLEPLTPWFVVKYSIQLSYGCKWCRGPESNRHGDHSPQDFKSCASTCSATPALEQFSFLRMSLLVNLVSERRDSNPRPPPWQGDVLPLNYFRKKKCRLKELNPRPSDYKSDALPTELSRLKWYFTNHSNKKWCGWRDLNPHVFQR